MANEKPIDALRLKAELGDRVSRALTGLTPEEQLRWIREEAAEYRRLRHTPVEDETRKTVLVRTGRDHRRRDRGG